MSKHPSITDKTIWAKEQIHLDDQTVRMEARIETGIVHPPEAASIIAAMDQDELVEFHERHCQECKIATEAHAVTFGVIDGAGRTIVSGLSSRVEAQGYAKACGTLEPAEGPYLIGEYAQR